MSDDNIQCAICGHDCGKQVSKSHLVRFHNMTTTEYKALGHSTLSNARLAQLRELPIAKGTVRRLYGDEHPNWKGGHVARSGYKIVSKRGKTNLYEHRLVAEQMVGRPLERDEVVHHVDGNRANNSPSNLVVMKRKEHDQLKDGARRYFHVDGYCEDACVDLYNLGWSKTRIEHALRVHHSTVQRWLTKHSDRVTRPINLK